MPSATKEKTQKKMIFDFEKIRAKFSGISTIDKWPQWKKNIVIKSVEKK